MSAAALAPTAPLVREGSEYWRQLTEECTRQVDEINSAVTAKGLSPENLVRCVIGQSISMVKSGTPSTLVNLLLGFHPWGPTLSVSITGRESEEAEFFPQESEMPVAVDTDGSVVAIFEEGRSFSSRELATYLAQAFRRCFPGVTLYRAS